MPELCPLDPMETDIEQVSINSEAELLAIHEHEPLAARWFALGALALKQGLVVTYYAEDGIDAHAAANSKGEEYFMSIDTQDGGRSWDWSYSWTANAGDEDEDQVEDGGSASTWPEAVAVCMATMGGLFEPR